ncbi:MAG: hypothetical protein WC449_04815 [Candidatus Paceibacterota bacterium]
MRNYGLEVAIPQAVKDEFVYRSRQQAFNHLLGWGIGLLSIAITVDIAIYLIMDMIAFPLLEIPAIVFALYKFSKALVQYTNEDRDILNGRYFSYDSIIEEVDSKEPETTDEITTIIPQANGKAHFNLHIGMTATQLKSIANTMLSTGTLTVNYIESLGISRQNAEKLRSELATYRLLSFDDKGRVKLTQDGIKVCKQIIKG